MLRFICCAVLALALSAAPLMAAECCPHCGSENAVDIGVAAACSDCGQATILGLSIPFTLVLAGILALLVTVVLLVAIRRFRAQGTPLKTTGVQTNPASLV